MSAIDSKREKKIEDVLRGLARQRIVAILQPGNVWVIERSLQVDEEVECALTTAYLRGWVEPLPHAFPSNKLNEAGGLPVDWEGFTDVKFMYRLTEGGWSIIRRSHSWILRTFWIAVATLIATLGGIYLSANSCQRQSVKGGNSASSHGTSIP